MAWSGGCGRPMLGATEGVGRCFRIIGALGLVGLLLMSAGGTWAQEEPEPSPSDAAAAIGPSSSQPMPTEAELLQDLTQGQAAVAVQETAGSELLNVEAAETAPADDAEVQSMAATASAGAPQMSEFESQSKNEVDQFVGGFRQSYTLGVPEFRGLEPALTLVYDSGRGNGFLGVGWKLEGISSIDRASVRKGSPAYESTDVFMLDNEELVACTAGMASPSCASGGTHATRIESYLKIAFNSTSNSWTVWSRTGTRHIYAPVATWKTDTDARRSTGFRWLLQSVQDTHDNQVQYGYWCNVAPDCYIDTISYNGTVIKFWRESRSDPIQYAIGAGYGQISYRLKSVDVQTNGQRVRAYALTYATGGATQRSRLSSVQEYGRDTTVSTAGVVSGGTALPPVSLAYSEGTGGYAVGTWLSALTTPSTAPITGRGDGWLPGDFDGDGRTDVLYDGSVETSNGTIVNYCAARRMLRSTGSAFAQAAWALSGCSSLANGTWRAADITGDGKTDLVLTGSPSVLISTGSGFTTQSWGTGPGSNWLLGDFNGDGREEFANPGVNSGCTISMRVSTGTAFSAQAWPVSASTCPTIPGNLAFGTYGTNGFVAGDFNGDGKTDLARGYHDTGFYLQVFLSTGSGFKVQYWNAGTWNAFTNERWMLGDYNGDGKTDFLRFTQQSYTYAFVYLSQGDGITEVNWTNGANYNVAPSTDRWSVGDVNGDGRDDVIRTNRNYSDQGASQRDINVFLSRGTAFSYGHWGEAPYETTGGGANGGPVTEVPVAGFVPGDYNGDGRIDLAALRLGSYEKCAVPGCEIYYYYWPKHVAITQGAFPDLLTGVTNELGGSTTVAYRASSAYANTNLPFVLQTVSSVTTNDGRGGVSTTGYTYSGGLWNALERRFLGFFQAWETLPCITGETACPRVETTFEQSMAGYSLPLHEVWRDGAGNVQQYFTNAYTINATTLPYTTLNWSTAHIVYEGATSKYVQEVRDFDAYGNVVRRTSLGNWALSGDEVTTYSDFAPNTTSYIVSLPSGKRIYAGTDDTTGVLKATSHFYYDGATSNATPPIDGNLTRQADWLDTISGYVNRYAEYDSYGNKTAAIDPEGSRTEWDYDSTYHLFVSETRDPLYFAGDTRHKTTAAWDGVCQRPDITYDLNGQATDYAYDALCRQTRVDMPDGGYSRTVFANIGTPASQYVIDFAPAADASGELYTIRYFNGLGQIWHRRAKGPDSTLTLILESTTYNARGQVSGQTAPFYTGGAQIWTTFSYDVLDRVTRQTHPDGSSILTQYGFSSTAGGFDTVTVTDELGRPTTVHMDAYGRTIRKDRLLSGTTVSTYYQYDVLGRLVGVTDNAGNQWTYTYDSLGRRLTANDPDLGSWTYVYDNAGRLIDQTDALGQVTHLTYDGLSRALSKTTRYGTGQAETTTYTYDQDRAGYYNVGQLTTLANAAATIEQDYDIAGRQARKRYIVDGNTYSFATGYDLGGRVLWQSYPDGDMAGTPVDPIIYDGAGRLKAIPGLVTDTTYDARGQVLTLTRANGTTTFYTYSATRGWLTEIKTVDAAGIDQVPDAFSFAAITGASRSTAYTSAIVTLGGFDGTLTLTLSRDSDGTAYRYRLAGGAWISLTSTSATIPVTSGTTLQLGLTASASYSTAANITASIGGRIATWTVTTMVAPTCAGGAISWKYRFEAGAGNYYTCYGTRPSTTYGQTVTTYDNVQPHTGSVRHTCSNGTWVQVTGSNICQRTGD